MSAVRVDGVPRNLARPRLLIISFSKIASDARVLKQIALFRDDYDVTTCGFGVAPEGVVMHHQVPTGYTAAKPYSRLLRVRLFSLAYWRQSAVRWARTALRGGRWEAVFANDPESLPLAFAVAPRDRVHADLHEYSPRMREHLPGWSRIYRPYYEWLARRFAARAASRTTVSRGLAEEYSRVFGFEIGLVTNAAPLLSLEPQPTRVPLRLVHSGGALEHRGLEEIVDAVALTTADVTLDLYLVPTDPALIERLRDRASDRVTIHPPVPYAELGAVLNGYDAGLHFLAPVNFNHANALPNKIFDYVQARLALVIGPTPEMARVVEEYSLGWVADGFTAADVAAVLDRLDAPSIDAAKAAAHAAAVPLSAERQVEGWRDAIDAIARVSSAPDAPGILRS